MPTIPLDVNPGRSPFQAGDIRAEANPQAMAQAGQGLEAAGAQVSAEGQQFANYYAQALRQKQAANLAFDGMSQMSEAQAKWSRVPDANTAIAGFQADSQKIRDQVSGQSSDPEVQAEVLRQLNSHAVWALNSVQRDSFALESSAQRAAVDDHLDHYAQMAATASNDITRASIADAGIGEIRSSVKAGWMYAEDGQKRITAFRNQLWGDALRRGLADQPQQTLAAIDAGQYDDRISPLMRDQLQPEIDRARGALIGGQVFRPGGAGALLPKDLPSDPAQALPLVKGKESQGNYNIGYGGADLANVPHDETGFPIWAGAQGPDGISHAAGAYQFEPATWHRYAGPLGIHDFSQASQDRVAQAAFAAEGYGPWAKTFGLTSGAPELDQARAEISQRVESGAISPRVGELAIGEVNRRYSIWRSETDGARYTLGRQLEDGKAMLEAGKTWNPPVAQIRALLPTAQANDVLQRLDEARGAGQAKNAVQFADPRQITQILADAQARVDSGVDVARNTHYLGQIHAALAERNKALFGPDADPAAFVRQSPIVVAAWGRIDPNNPGPGMEAGITASLAEQARLGVPDEQQRALTKNTAAVLAQKLAREDPATVTMAPQLDQLAQTYGKYWNKAFGEMVKAGLPAEYQVLATMDRPEQIVAAGDYQRMLGQIGKNGGAQKLKEAIAPEVVKTIDNGLPDIMRDFRATVPDPLQYQIMAGAVTNLARYYSYAGNLPDVALQRAYDGIIGQHWDFAGALRVPKGQLDTVKAAGQAIQNAITPQQLMTPNGPLIMASAGPGQPEPNRTPQDAAEALGQEPEVPTFTDLARGLRRGLTDFEPSPAPPAPTPTTAKRSGPVSPVQLLTEAERDAIYQDAVRRGFWATNEADDGAVLMLRYRNGGLEPARLYDGSRVEFKFAAAPAIVATMDRENANAAEALRSATMHDVGFYQPVIPPPAPRAPAQRYPIEEAPGQPRRPLIRPFIQPNAGRPFIVPFTEPQ